MICMIDITTASSICWPGGRIPFVSLTRNVWSAGHRSFVRLADKIGSTLILLCNNDPFCRAANKGLWMAAGQVGRRAGRQLGSQIRHDPEQLSMAEQAHR